MPTTGATVPSTGVPATGASTTGTGATTTATTTSATSPGAAATGLSTPATKKARPKAKGFGLGKEVEELIQKRKLLNKAGTG